MKNTIEIPIILSSDDNYAPYLAVTLTSILFNGSKEVFYDIYLLLAPDFSLFNKNKIIKLAKKYKNNKINFINMDNAFSNLKRMISHISNPTYYRLNAANILPKKYSKCIYFDVDVVVNIDLKKYYEIELNENYMAGVKAPGYIMNKKGNKNYCEMLGIPSIENYINAGAVIMNLKKIREHNLSEKFNNIAQNNYPSVDQDVINKVCYGKIKIISPKYNVMIARINSSDEDLRQVYSIKEIKEARKNPLIIHYSTNEKPWNILFLNYSKYWWKYAVISNYFSEIILIFMKNKFKPKKKFEFIKKICIIIKSVM